MDLAVEELNGTVCSEIAGLVRDYYATTPAHTGLPPYNFNWDAYLAMQDAGNLVVATCRSFGKLVGVAIYITIEHLHHRGWKIALCDSLSTHKDYRKRGIGSDLMRFAEPLLIERGVKRIIHTHRVCYNSEPLFTRHGYGLEEHTYVKDV